MKFTKEGIYRSVDRLQTASGYDVTIKLYHQSVIERAMHAVNAIIVLDVFCSCYSDFQWLATHSSAILPSK